MNGRTNRKQWRPAESESDATQVRDAFADNQPVTAVVDAVRGFLLGQPSSARTWQAFVWCAAILAIFAPLAVSLYRRTTAR